MLLLATKKKLHIKLVNFCLVLMAQMKLRISEFHSSMVIKMLRASNGDCDASILTVVSSAEEEHWLTELSQDFIRAVKCVRVGFCSLLVNCCSAMW